MAIEVFNIIVIAIYLITALQGLRIYQFVDSKNYFYISLILLLFGIDILLIDLGFVDSFAEVTVFVLYIFFFQVIGHRQREKQRYFGFIFLVCLLAATYTAILLSLLFQSTYPTLLYFRWICFEFFILTSGIYLILPFYNVKMVKRSKKLVFGKYFWIFLGFTAMIAGIIRVIAFVIAWNDTISNGSIVSMQYPSIQNTNIIPEIAYVIIGLGLVIIVLFTPETLLFRKAEIFKSAKLLDFISKIELSDSSDKQILSSMDLMRSYLESLKDIISNREFELN